MKRLWMIALTALLSSFFPVSVSPGDAQSNGWSFEAHPHPARAEWTEAEEILISQAHRLVPISVLCQQLVAVHFEMYQHRYPDFIQNGAEDQNFLDWTVHAASPDLDAGSTCMFFLPTDRIDTLLHQKQLSNFTYCGRYSRPPISDHEKALTQQLDYLVRLAEVNLINGSSHFLTLNHETNLVELNSDLVYFFSLVLQPYQQAHDRIPELIDLAPDLPDNRKTFVEQAAQKHDLGVVLTTTKACPLE